MVVHAQVFPGAIAQGALLSVFHAPVQGACELEPGLQEHWQQRHTIQRVIRMGRHACSVKQGACPVHRHAVLLADLSSPDLPGPVGDPGDPDTALGQIHLAAHKGPVVRKPLTAVVAGEHQQSVVRQAMIAQRLHHLADAFVHVVDHALVGVNIPAVQVDYLLAKRGCQGLVFAGLPGPVWGGVMQTQQQGLPQPRRCCLAGNVVHRMAGDQVGQIALSMVLQVG